MDWQRKDLYILANWMNNSKKICPNTISTTVKKGGYQGF